MTISMASSVAN